MLCTIHALVIWEEGGGGKIFELLQKKLVVNTDTGGGDTSSNSEDQPLQTEGTSSPHSSYEFLL